MEQFDIPVVLICFKRLDTTLQILRRIAAVKPKKLYLMSDQGRDDQEKETVSKLRQLLEEAIDWPCEVIKNYAETNRGVFANIALGAKYVFEREEKVIFLEDDNLPEVTFFGFCKELLDRYEHDDRVFWICGTNYEAKTDFADHSSYTFTRNLLPCGWASWRGKFLKYYDFELKGLDNPETISKARSSFINKSLFKQQLFNVQGERHRMDSGTRCISWDSQMAFSIRATGTYGIVPCSNQIKNIGVDENSIHGGSDASFVMTQRFCGMDSYPMELPLKHPAEIRTDAVFEKRLEETILFPLSIRLKGILVRMIKRILNISRHEPIGRALKERRK